jgi:hypothetical protein
VRTTGQDFLSSKIDRIAQLAISPTCWSFSQTINFLRVAGWAFWFQKPDQKGGGKDESFQKRKELLCGLYRRWQAEDEVVWSAQEDG